MLGNLAGWDPFGLHKSPSLVAPLEEQEPQTEDTSPNTIPPSSASPPPYKPLYPSLPEMQPEPLCPLQEVVGGP